MTTLDNFLHVFASDAGVDAMIWDHVCAVEDAIARKQLEHPDREDEIWHMFSALLPPIYLARAPQKIIRIYAEQRIEQLLAGDTDDVTSAEVLFVLSEVSVRVPLSSDYAAAMEQVFRECFPEVDGEVLGGVSVQRSDAVVRRVIDAVKTELRKLRSSNGQRKS